jgi:hypothetical protein
MIKIIAYLIMGRTARGVQNRTGPYGGGGKGTGRRLGPCYRRVR